MFSSDSNHWQEYDIEKCPHQLLLRSPLSLPVIGPTEADDHWISWGPDPRRRNIEFQCLFHPPKNYIWWSSSLKLSPVIACEHLGCQPWHNTDSQKFDAAFYQEQEHGEDWNIWIILPFIPIALFYEGQRNPENKYSGGGGISIQFSKMVFLYKCESLFSVHSTVRVLIQSKYQSHFAPKRLT